VDSTTVTKFNRNIAEKYVKDIFASHYDANIRSFMPTIITLSEEERLLASVSLRSGAAENILVEKYLQLPIQQEIKKYISRNVLRSDVVEVGNMVASSLGGARKLIYMLTAFLKGAGFKYVIFTATPQLLNTFNRLGLSPKFLAFADREKIKFPDDWGSYYETKPQVVFGCVNEGYRLLKKQITEVSYAETANLWNKSLKIGVSSNKKSLPEYINIDIR